MKTSDCVSNNDKHVDVISVLNELYYRLEDELSRDIFLCMISYRITYDYLFFGKMIESHYPDIKSLPMTSPEQLGKMNKMFALYGAGGDADYYHQFFERIGKDRIIGFCDKDRGKQESGWRGFRVFPPEILLDREDVLVIITASSREKEIKDDLKQMGISDKRIIDRVFPVQCGIAGQYFDTDVIQFEKEETFIDAGSYDLSTVLELKTHTDIRKVYAFEADPDNYEKCLSNISNPKMQNIPVELHKQGLWSHECQLSIGACGGGDASFFWKSGKEKLVNVCALDDIVGDDKITFIKMDIEGSELEALKGSKKTIKKFRPKLAICVYHKPEDIYEIPSYILELNPDYKLYLRHYTNRQSETVLYAV